MKFFKVRCLSESFFLWPFTEEWDTNYILINVIVFYRSGTGSCDARKCHASGE